MSLILNLKTVIKSLWIVKVGNNVQFRVVRVHEAVKKDNSVHVSFNLTICCRWLSSWMCAFARAIFIPLLCACCCVHSAPSCRPFAYYYLLSSNLSESSRGGIQTIEIFPLCTHTAATIHRPFQIFASRLFVKLVPLFCPRILHLVYHLFAQLWWLLPCSLARVSVWLCEVTSVKWSFRSYIRFFWFIIVSAVTAVVINFIISLSD
jgi:hypothetical protein